MPDRRTTQLNRAARRDFDDGVDATPVGARSVGARVGVAHHRVRRRIAALDGAARVTPGLDARVKAATDLRLTADAADADGCDDIRE